MNFNNSYRPAGFGGMPVVTKNIIIINILLFVLKMILLQVRGIDLDDYFGLHYHLASDFKPHQFITYIFMHVDLRHVGFNMIGVYIFGQVLEYTWGPKRYLAFYILTGFGAAIAQYVIMHFQISHTLDLVNMELASPLMSAADKADLINQKYDYLNRNVIVGASGSLFGLMGAFAMLFPNRELMLLFLPPIKAKWLIGAYAVMEIVSGLRNDPQDNVAHIAHLGGLAVGIILVLIWRKGRNHFY